MGNEMSLRAPGRNIEVGPTCRKLNPHLFPHGETGVVVHTVNCTFGELSNEPPVKYEPKRIKQSSKPKSNKLETRYGLYLKAFYPSLHLIEQDITLHLANGCRYTIDWAALTPDGFFCWEVKGKHSWDDAIVKLKVAARTFPEFKFFLVDEVDGRWREQVVLP